jgi:hypothetical protein
LRDGEGYTIRFDYIVLCVINRPFLKHNASNYADRTNLGSCIVYGGKSGLEGKLKRDLL